MFFNLETPHLGPYLSSTELPSQSDNFGNYMLKDFEELAIVPKIPWDFSAPGWPYLFTLLALFTIFLIHRYWKRRKLNSYRRKALKTLDSAMIEGRDKVLKIIPLLLKSTAMTTYGRHGIAPIYGEQWLNFLNEKLPEKETAFENSIGKLLVSISYQNYSQLKISPQDYEKLIRITRRWIISHKEIVNA